MSNLSEQARALAAQAASERDALQQRKADLLAEREEQVARVREEYRVRLDDVEAQLGLVDRLRKALDPEAVKAERAAAKPANGRGPGRPPKLAPTEKGWRPNDEALAVVLGAILDGKETVGQISRAREDAISRASVDRAVNVLREDGLIRLAGTGEYNAKTYRATPQGKEWLAARGGVANGAVA